MLVVALGRAGAVSYSRDSVWTGAELDALRAHYPRHCPGWDGWAEALPGRTWQAIRLKAGRIGVYRERRRTRPEPEPACDPAPTPDPCEGPVLAMMAAGATPRQIDARMHWVPGRARKILTERWKREGETWEK